MRNRRTIGPVPKRARLLLRKYEEKAEQKAAAKRNPTAN